MGINKTQTHSILNTPVKQSLANQQPIRKENTMDCLDLGSFQGEIQARNKGGSCNRNDLIQERRDSRGIALGANDSACRDAAHMCHDFSYEGLMQLANAAAAVAEERRILHVESSSFASDSNNMVELAPSQVEPSGMSNMANLGSKKNSKGKEKVISSKDTSLPQKKTQGVLVKEPQSTSNPAGITHSESSLQSQPNLPNEIGALISTSLGVEQPCRPITTVADPFDDRLPTVAENVAEDVSKPTPEDDQPLIRRKRKTTEFERTVKASGSAGKEFVYIHGGQKFAPPPELSSKSCKVPKVAQVLNKSGILPADMKDSKAVLFEDLVSFIRSDTALIQTRMIDLLERATEMNVTFQAEVQKAKYYKRVSKERSNRILGLEKEVKELKNQAKTAEASKDVKLGLTQSEIEENKSKVAEAELSVAAAKSRVVELNDQNAELQSKVKDLEAETSLKSAALEKMTSLAKFWKNKFENLAKSNEAAVNEFLKSERLENNLKALLRPLYSGGFTNCADLMKKNFEIVNLDIPDISRFYDPNSDLDFGRRLELFKAGQDVMKVIEAEALESDIDEAEASESDIDEAEANLSVQTAIAEQSEYTNETVKQTTSAE